MEDIFINFAPFGVGVSVGMFIGYTLGKMEQKRNHSKKPIKNGTFYIIRQCDTYMKHTRSILARMVDLKVFYKKDKIITNDCPALLGTICKHTKAKCGFL